MQAQLEAIFQSLADGVFVFDLNGRLVRMNHAAAVTHGYPDVESVPSDLTELAKVFELHTLDGVFIPGEEWPISRVIAGERFSGWILQVSRKDLNRKWIFSYSGNPALDENGTPKLAVLAVRNITEQMQVQQELRRSQVQLKLVTDSVPVLISYLDRDYFYRYVNEAYATWFKRPIEEIVNRPARAVLGKRAFASIKGYADRALSGETVLFDQELSYEDGMVRHVRGSYTPDLDSEGNVRGFVASVSDLTELKKAERKLAASEERFRKIAESLPQLVWTATAEGLVDYYNDRIAHYSGVKRETYGWRWEPMVHPEDVQRTVEAWTKAAMTKADYQCEHRILMKDGSYHWHLSRGTPLSDSEGTRWFGTATDIHDQKIVEVELKAAKEEAERANRLKSAFLANMSHEIRTPLGAILGFTDLMRDPNLSAQEREDFADIVNRNGEQLSAVINDILDLSKVEAGHISLEFSDADPTAIAVDVTSLLQVNADVKELKLQFMSDATTPKSVATDPTRLRQILTNVIGNAIKFTSAGSVQVRSFGKDGLTCIEVVDTGIGIPPEARERVFDAFVQADVTLSRKYGGTGLGLALSRQLARSMGGDVVITDSDVGKGTRFLISVADQPEKIPQDRKQQSKMAKNGEHGKEALKGIRTLVVDDSEDNRMLIGHFLKGVGAEVDFARNGLEGCRKALTGAFDVVLMDIQMPEMDGYTATMKLRESGYNKPIVALTAHAMGEARKKCLQVGCSDHLTKPINVKALVSTVEKFGRPDHS